jgi:large subunit ribosomal protein L4e
VSELALKLVVPVYNLEGESVGQVELPAVFKTPLRRDLIRRAFLSAFTARLQPKGTDPLAGLRTTAESLGVGYGIARVARIKGGLRAARVPQAVKGRRAHPPKVEKRLHERINKKERRLALMSAIAATALREVVESRGHVVPDKPLPVVVEDKLESISQTSELKKVLVKLGLWADVERAHEGTRVRAGKGKMRGRRYKVPVSLLIVVRKNDGIVKAARNLPGVTVKTVGNLSVLDLAPGGHPGRLTVYTVGALEELRARFPVEVVQK